MKKKVLSLVFMAFIMSIFIAISAFGASATSEVARGTCGGEGDGTNITWTLDDEGTLTISGTGAMEDDPYSPSTESSIWIVDDVNYTEQIKKVVINEGISKIGQCAFINCEYLTNIDIPDGVTSIGDFAFVGCISIESVHIPDSVTSIGCFAFENCTSLTEITIPDSVTSLERSVFRDCTSLKRVELPDTLKSIDHYAFQGCTALKRIDIPDSVTKLGVGVFWRCDGLEKIFIPDNVTEMGKAFSSVFVYYEGTQEQWEEAYGSSSSDANIKVKYNCDRLPIASTEEVVLSLVIIVCSLLPTVIVLCVLILKEKKKSKEIINKRENFHLWKDNSSLNSIFILSISAAILFIVSYIFSSQKMAVGFYLTPIFCITMAIYCKIKNRKYDNLFIYALLVGTVFDNFFSFIRSGVGSLDNWLPIEPPLTFGVMLIGLVIGCLIIGALMVFLISAPAILAVFLKNFDKHIKAIKVITIIYTVLNLVKAFVIIIEYIVRFANNSEASVTLFIARLSCNIAYILVIVMIAVFFLKYVVKSKKQEPETIEEPVLQPQE